MLATVLLSHASDDTARRFGRGTMYMTGRAGDGATESCWQWCYQGDLAATRCRCQVMLATVLPSHTGDGAIIVTWPWRDIDAE
jgi:hypothetical protein